MTSTEELEEQLVVSGIGSSSDLLQPDPWPEAEVWRKPTGHDAARPVVQCMPTPHDTFFTNVFSHLEVVAEQLRSALPAALVPRLDWSTLRLGPTVSKDEHGKELRSDLMFAIDTLDGEPLLVVLLFEHQRRVDRLMGFRIVEYKVPIWRQWIRDDQARSGQTPKRLPAICPVVLYNGLHAWTAATSIEALTDSPVALDLGELRLRGSFQLIDLTAVSEAAIRAGSMHAHLQLGLLLLKHIDAPDIWDRLGVWALTLARVFLLPSGVQRIQAVLTYIAGVAGAPPRKALESIMSHLPAEAARVTKTWGETLRDEGRAEEKATILLALLRQKFSTAVTDVHSARVHRASIEELDVWLMRVLAAGSVEDVLADPT